VKKGKPADVLNGLKIIDAGHICRICISKINGFGNRNGTLKK